MAGPKQFRYTGAAAAVLLMLGGAAAAQDVPDGIEVYSNARYHWSIAYPANWALEAGDEQFIRIVAPEKNGICGVRSRPTSQATADALADYALAYAKKNLKEHKGLDQVTVSRERTRLHGDVEATAVTVAIEPGGGQARRIYAVVGGNGFMVDCAASDAAWHSNEPQFRKIIASFTPSR
jgi:hypothetical protein